MVDKRKTFGLSVASLTLLAIGVLVALNLVSTRFFGRADLTENNAYSLSEASRGVADNLEDPLIARAYISDDLPPDLITVRQYLLDLLAEYRAYGKGKFQFEVINPSTPEGEQEAQGYRVSPFQANVFEHDKLEMKLVYLGLVFIHGDRQEPIPAINSTRGLEYLLTSAIRRATQQSLGTIGILTGTGGPSLDQGLRRLSQLVAQEYRVRPVDLSTGPVPADVGILAVIGPQSTLSDTVLYRIDQYVMHGGPAMFLLEGAVANMQGSPQQGGGMAFPTRGNADSLAAFYGAAPAPQLVLDARSNQIQAMQNLGILQIPVAIEFPFFVAASTFDREHALGRELNKLDLLLTSPLAINAQSEAPVTVVAKSSDRSGVRSLPAMVMPPVEVTAQDFSAPGQPLVAAIEGSLRSFFTDTARAAAVSLGPAFDAAFAAQSPATRLIVVGDADLATDRAMSQFNQVFLLNAFDWLSGNDMLIALRSRQVQDRPLEELEPGSRSRIKWANLIGPPFIVVVFGLVRWRRRAAAKRNI
jgi:gliding-associated putative ABC transporter substrate-binding component GldG